MILIADSGSTKTDWAFCEQGKVTEQLQTQGLNPFFLSEETMLDIVASGLAPAKELLGKVTAVYFYGSGCRAEVQPKVRKVLQECLPEATSVEVHGDLLGAARALFGRHAGVACILGTGSNSCYYDGETIVHNVPPLGYVLGDEGSGAFLGKTFLNVVLKGAEYGDLRDAFMEWAGLSLQGVLQRVYSEPLPNRFLASIAPFLSAHLAHPVVRGVVEDGMRMFVERNLLEYRRAGLWNKKGQPCQVGAVGSIAFHFEAQLRSAVESESGFKLLQVQKSPVEGLAAFHANEKA